MTPEQRREMIVAAALPLVAEHGTAVTTAKVARAAGIGEATVFRVFADKDELLDACVAEAVRPDHAVREIAAVPMDLPLAERLTEAADALGAHLARIGAVVGALHSSGHRAEQPRREPPAPGSRDASLAAIRDAIAELLEPERERLRLPVDQVAGVFLGLLFARSRPLEEGPGTAALVDLFLNGALSQGDRV
jgi:AcrR family transcriptional regulator